MGQIHTYTENILNVGLNLAADVTALNFSDAIDTIDGRANAALVSFSAISGVDDSGSNQVTISMEDSPDGTNWTPVANGGNDGVEQNAFYGLMDAQQLINDASLVIDGVNVIVVPPREVISCEYKGNQRYFRLAFVAIGTAAGTMSVYQGQGALRKDPNIVDIGNNG